jgi:integrase
LIFNGFVLPDWYTRVVHMTLAMARPWKHPNSGVYWLRKRVPDDLRALVGKREEKRSLGTRDPQEAKRRHAQLMTELDARWSNLRASPRVLSEREATEIATAVYEQHISQHSENPSDQKFWDIELGKALWVREPMPRLIDEKTMIEWLATPDPDFSRKLELREWCLSVAQQALDARGLAASSENKDKMARAVSVAMQNASVTLSRYAHGDYGTNAASSHVQINSRPMNSGGRSQKAITFESLFEGWVAEKLPGAKTRYSWERVLKQLASFLEHNDATQLTADDLIRWKASLIAAGLKTKTIRDGKLAPVRAILQWGVDSRILVQNPGERVTIDLKAKLVDRKRGYSDDEASKVLKAALTQSNALRRWVPFICAYTGARVSEVCQIRAEDILQIDGVWCVRFAPEAGSLKNAGSERAVPLHPALLGLGILKMAQKARAGSLFATASPDRFGSRGGNGAKIIARWVRSLGLDDPRISPNHSWRHRLRTLGRRYGLSTDILDAITGHQRKTVADRYGEFPISALHREISKIPTLKI